jgi:hypothetical protein
MHSWPESNYRIENKKVKCIWRVNVDNLPSKIRMANQR